MPVEQIPDHPDPKMEKHKTFRNSEVCSYKEEATHNKEKPNQS